MNEPFYKFKMEDGEDPSSAELLIFSQIGDWEEMGDVSARGFAKELAKLPSSVKRIDLHINSPGGSVFEASAIYSRLADHRSTKHVYVDGLAASAASVIAMVGHKIYIRANAMMMIHLPSGITMGNADDMRHMATALDAVTDTMINIYAKRTGGEREAIRDLMANETWFTPQDAVEQGFADEMRGVVKAAAIVGEKKVVINGCQFDLSRFNNVPAFTAVASTPTQTQRKVTMKKKVKAQTTEDLPNDDDAGKEKPASPEEAGEGEGNGEGEDAGAGTETPPSTEEATIPKKPATAGGEPVGRTAFAKGVATERARIAALQKLDRPATHAIVAKAIEDGSTAGDIAAACMEAMDKVKARSDRRVDASELDGIPASDGTDDDDSFGKLLKTKVAARLKNRGRVYTHSRN
jgi:ATP-dependent protease ClpP protease subunit